MTPNGGHRRRVVHNCPVTDMYPPPAPGQHDTTAIQRPQPPMGDAPGGAYGYGPGLPAGYGPADPGYYGPGFPGNPAADAWEARFRKQRTRTRIAVTVAAVVSVLALVLGVAAWQLSQSNPLLAAAADLGSGLDDLGPDEAVPPATTPDDGTGSAPDTSAPGGAADGIPLSELPLPDALKDLASNLGITEVGQLLDLAVANGLMSQEEADRVRAALATGALVGGLTDQ